MRKPFIRKHLRAAIALSLVPASFTTQAQNDSYELEEILVTAQKRVQNIQDVPISISAITGTKIADAGISDMDDLSRYVPNLNISTGNNTQIRMRGLGSGLNKGFEQSVGMYIDGIYHGRDRSYRGSLMDLERVEVLRGPQGILFGKNTIAGAINITTAKPDQTPAGEIGLTFGTDNERKIRTMLSGPISESLSARIAIVDEQRDGYIENSLPAADGVDTEDRLIRATLVWDASEALTATLKFETGEFERFGTTYQVTDSGTLTDAYFAQFAPGFESRFDGKTHIDNTLGDQKEHTESDNVTLNLTYQLGEFTLTSITARIGFDSNDDLDVDFSPVPLVFQNLEQDFEQISQELRLSSPGGETVDYIVGLYYQNSDFKYSDLTRYNLLPLAINTQASTFKQFDQESDSWAAFAEASWNISSQLTLTGGLRYSRETKEASSSLSTAEINGSPATPTTLFVLSNFGIAAHAQKEERSESNITPLIKATYALSDDTMIYASASTGFKGGGFNTEVLNPANSPFEFDHESSKAVEVGVKNTFLEGAAQFNLALFRTEFEDLQVSGFDGRSFIVDNAAEATSQGIELDGMWRLSENLTLGGSYAYLDAQYDNYTNAPCTFAQKAATAGAACQQDLSGKSLHYAPEHSANVSINYEYPVADNYLLEFTADANYSDEFLLQTDLDPIDKQTSFTKYNARIVLKDLTRNWELALIGKNLSDKRTANNGVDVPLLERGAHIKNTMPPRSVAVQILAKF